MNGLKIAALMILFMGLCAPIIVKYCGMFGFICIVYLGITFYFECRD